MISLSKTVNNPLFSIYRFNSMREFRFVKFMGRHLFNIGFNKATEREVGFYVNISENCPFYVSTELYFFTFWIGILERAY